MNEQFRDRWEVRDNEIVWQINKKEEHIDNIEMAGRKLAVVVYYGTDENGALSLRKVLHYPTLRTIPNNTHATLRHEYTQNERIRFALNGVEISECVSEVSIAGMVKTITFDEAKKICITRFHYPSIDKMAYIEHTTVQNVTDSELEVTSIAYNDTSYDRGTKGVYVLEAETQGPQSVLLKPGQAVAYDTVYTGRLLLEEKPAINGTKELVARREYVSDLFTKSLVLESNDPILNCEFNFSKLRVTESIYDTAKGPMHSPGGQNYYAAIWANDQAEYAAPYFGFSGVDYAHKACVNLMDLYRPFMHPELHHIPASIIAEGYDIWEYWGDEGDAAQYIYGMTRYILETGDIELGREYFDTIDWCVRYELTKETDHHLIAADADELEHRLPCGEANLLNTSLVYGGLICAHYIAKDLGHNDKAEEYLAFANRLRDGIENVLGADLEGYHTYRYFEGYDDLRSYNATPLTVGIFDRKEGTVAALLDKLWTDNGLLSAQSDTMFWDRSTLYAMRGIFRAGFDETGYEYLNKYNHKRLLGDHVPYPVEAWPEGDQRHLSAESGLYARTIIEGMFGINPTGFRSFTVSPTIPECLGNMALRRIKAFGGCFDVEVLRSGNEYNITVTNADGVAQNFAIPVGESVEVTL